MSKKLRRRLDCVRKTNSKCTTLLLQWLYSLTNSHHMEREHRAGVKLLHLIPANCATSLKKASGFKTAHLNRITAEASKHEYRGRSNSAPKNET